MTDGIQFNGVHVAIIVGVFFIGLAYGYITGYLYGKDERSK